MLTHFNLIFKLIHQQNCNLVGTRHCYYLPFTSLNHYETIRPGNCFLQFKCSFCYSITSIYPTDLTYGNPGYHHCMHRQNVLGWVNLYVSFLNPQSHCQMEYCFVFQSLYHHSKSGHPWLLLVHCHQCSLREFAHHKGSGWLVGYHGSLPTAGHLDSITTRPSTYWFLHQTTY